MRLSQKIIDVAELRKQQQPQQQHSMVEDHRTEVEEGVGMHGKMNAVAPSQQHVKLQPLEVDVAIVG